MGQTWVQYAFAPSNAYFASTTMEAVCRRHCLPQTVDTEVTGSYANLRQRKKSYCSQTEGDWTFTPCESPSFFDFLVHVAYHEAESHITQPRVSQTEQLLEADEELPLLHQLNPCKRFNPQET